MCVWFVTIILDFRANDELTLPCNVTLLQAGKPLALERRGFFFGWDLHECKRHCSCCFAFMLFWALLAPYNMQMAK
jgi:hypothetical protein